MSFLRRSHRGPLAALALLIAVTNTCFSAARTRPPSEDSGGHLSSDQAAYDVRHCTLNLQVNPHQKTISGTATLHLKTLQPLRSVVLDLDSRFTVTRVTLGRGPARIRNAYHSAGKLRVALGRTFHPGEEIILNVKYAGKPRHAKRAPWDGGFTWSKTSTGLPWIATSVQVEGADLWWPSKDNPSDEPDSFTLRIRVPQPLVVASNGRLVEVLEHSDRTRTYHWHTDFPINNYNIALNIAPYATITTNYISTAGLNVPATFWFLPENRTNAERIIPEFLQHLNFYERYLGPYPFRAEKYGVAETPHLGMEHQTIIAYGNRYRGGPFGYDWLHHHELGHEWWGNLVTARHVCDLWLHEGLCTYMQALYTEERDGMAAYHRHMADFRKSIHNRHPLLPSLAASMQELDSTAGNDIYYKGAWIIHMLRYLVGKEQMLSILRQFCYPTPELELRSDASICRLVTTGEFVTLANHVSGKDLNWFFDFYLKQPALPKLVQVHEGNRLVIRWQVPAGYQFPMPVEVSINGKVARIELPHGQAELDLDHYPLNSEWDPACWILKEK